MKTFAILLALAALARTGLADQTNQVDLKTTRATPPPSTAPPSPNGNLLLAPGTNSTTRLLRPERNYGGALVDLRRRKSQFFRRMPGETNAPNAPFQNVSVNPTTGRADGVILFSIGF